MSFGGKAFLCFPADDQLGIDPKLPGELTYRPVFLAAKRHDLRSEHGQQFRTKSSTFFPNCATSGMLVRQGAMRSAHWCWGGKLLLCATVLLCCACASVAPQESLLQIRDESGEPNGALPPVVRLHLSGIVDVAPQDFWWIDGDVSRGYSDSLARGEVPDAVESKRLPLATWVSEEGAVVLAPSEALLPGHRYSLVALGRGKLAEFRAADSSFELWARWGSGDVSPDGWVSYCRFDSFPSIRMEDARGASAWDEQGDELVSSGAAQNFFEDSCLRLRVHDQAGEFFVPPPAFGSIYLDPRPIKLKTGHSESKATRASPHDGVVADCLRLAGAEICVQDAALSILPPAGPFGIELWVAERMVATFASSEAVEQPLFMGPLVPETEYEVRAAKIEYTASGELSIQRGTLLSATAAPRFVLNEVMSNPAGPEPQGEWVEIVNAGTASGSVSGLQLWDEGAGVALPDVELEPGQFGLILRHDYVLGDELPPPEAVPLFVAELGRNGLRNSGEVLELRGKDGRVLSAVPKHTTREGASWARLTPWAPDLVASFSEEQTEGPTAGRENRF